MSVGWPQAIVVINGRLFHVTGDFSGWHAADTWLPGRSAVSAVNTGGQWPRVMRLGRGP